VAWSPMRLRAYIRSSSRGSSCWMRRCPSTDWMCRFGRRSKGSSGICNSIEFRICPRRCFAATSVSISVGTLRARSIRRRFHPRTSTSMFGVMHRPEASRPASRSRAWPRAPQRKSKSRRSTK
jgi:hypothetical protein